MEAPNCGGRPKTAGPVVLREQCNSKASPGSVPQDPEQHATTWPTGTADKHIRTKSIGPGPKLHEFVVRSEEVGLPKHINTLSKGAGKILPLNAKDYFEAPPHPAGLISPVPAIRK
jgi:hypothetical protein